MLPCIIHVDADQPSVHGQGEDSDDEGGVEDNGVEPDHLLAEFLARKMVVEGINSCGAASKILPRDSLEGAASDFLVDVIEECSGTLIATQRLQVLIAPPYNRRWKAI